MISIRNILYLFIVSIIPTLTTAQNNIIPCTGLDADHEGVFAYNIAGTNTGHNIPSPYNAFGNDIAYYYFDSRDVENYDPLSSYGMHGSGSITGFPQFSTALNAAGKTISDIKVRVSGPNLGSDIEGQDWNFNGPIETRYYANGKYAILIGSDTILTGESGNSTLVIDYNSSGTPYDDQMSGFSDYSIPSIATSDSIGLILANAFLTDISQFGIRMNFTSFQRAGQTEYNSGNVTGAFFEIQQATIESGNLVIPDLGKDQMNCSGDSVLLDAGAGRNGYLWNTGDTTQKIYVKKSGEYFVRIDSSGIKAYSAPVKLTFDVCTSTKLIESSPKFTVQPNPASESFTISTDLVGDKRLKIFNALGNVILQKDFQGSSLSVNTRDFQTGVYFITIMNGQKQSTKRVVIL